MPDITNDSDHDKNNPDNGSSRGILRTLSSMFGKKRSDGAVSSERRPRNDRGQSPEAETAPPKSPRGAEADTESPRQSGPRSSRPSDESPAPRRRRSRGGRNRRRTGRNPETESNREERADSAAPTAGPVVEEGRARRRDSDQSRSSRTGTPRRRRGRGRERSGQAETPSPADERAPLQNEGSALGSYDGPERGKFGDIDVSGPVAAALAEMGYETPSPIQQEAVPGCLDGRDLVGQAITGSGKTAAFSIPLVERVDPYNRDVQAIVLVPTRELAMQVAREVERIGKYRGISVCAVYGGQPIHRQFAQLERGANVVVGTPGRIMDHMGRGTLDLQHVRVAVLDEADEMLDIGFAEDMEFILRRTPRSRQTLLFSATIPGFVKRLIRRYQDDPMWIQLGAEIETVDEVDQIYFEVAERDKQAALRLVLEDMTDDFRMLVFRRTQIGVDRLSGSLKRAGFGVMGLHGGLSQGERNRAMGAFRDGALPILVSTNVAARGIDIPEITHVVNYDLPDNVEEYVHRIGRTARMGRRGYAVTFLAEWDFEAWEKIRDHVGDDRLIQGTLPLYD